MTLVKLVAGIIHETISNNIVLTLFFHTSTQLHNPLLTNCSSIVKLYMKFITVNLPRETGMGL